MGSIIKRFLKKYPLLYASLRKVRIRLFPKPKTCIERIIEAVLDNNEPVFFVQVGSNDGFSGDPIHSFVLKNKNWRGIFVEPVKSAFNWLKQNYGNSDRFVFENVAISTKKEIRDFYHVPERAGALSQINLPAYYEQLGSFDRHHVLKHLDRSLESYIVADKVECLPLQDILTKNRVRRIDLLHIDAEGFDYAVLSQVDFSRYKPLIILYESTHLSSTEKDGAEKLLKGNGYSFIESERDIVAVLGIFPLIGRFVKPEEGIR